MPDPAGRRRRNAGLRALALAGLLLGLGVLAPFLVPQSPFDADLDARLRPPDRGHWLGTDDLGRDVFSRLIAGAQVSISTASSATTLALLLGISIGSLAGVTRGATSFFARSLIEVVQTVPGLVLAVAAATFFSPSAVSTAVIIGFTAWVDLARATSALSRDVMESSYTAFANASGASRAWIFSRHVLRNVLWPAFAFVPYILGGAIVTEASLAFLGLGTPPPAPSWGRSLADARSLLPEAWWCLLPPAACLLASVLVTRRLGAELQALWIDGRNERPLPE